MRLSVLLFAVALLGCRKHDLDGDGALDADDCDLANAAVFPGAEEVCNGVDDDCNGTVDDTVNGALAWFADADFDGFGDARNQSVSCVGPLGFVNNDLDCDDADAAFHPGAAEADCADPRDFNCDGSTGFVDEDKDGAAACDDCDDGDPDVHPGAGEVCDGLDDDCDGDIDEDASDAVAYSFDIDGDKHGNPRFVVTSCDPPDGYVPGADADDCDDLDASSFPGAVEQCDGRDNNCDSQIDEGATGKTPFYPDSDQDSFGDPGGEVLACERPPGYASNFEDCDDTNPDVNPAASESCTDPVDVNCDGSFGQDDADDDGTVACDDCDDTRADVNPSAPELCDGVDNDCNGKADESAPVWYADLDADGVGGDNLTVAQCSQPAGYVAAGGDCNDLDARAKPGAQEVCDGSDNDCNGTVDDGAPVWFADVDGDGHAGDNVQIASCVAPSGFAATADDCDDLDPSSFPTATELCDGVDNDCAGGPGATETDVDLDGFLACDGDCDDTDRFQSPVARELCNGADDDCDGNLDDDAVDVMTWFVDVDGDGFGSSTKTESACTVPAGYAGNDRDCDDGASGTFPGGVEVCGGKDEDCDGDVDEASASGTKAFFADGDGDGKGSSVTTTACVAPAGFVAFGGDCDDADKSRPGAEVCNGVDDDCDGAIPVTETDVDGDGYIACKDCDDAVMATHPGAQEVCNNVDDDCDGTKDESAVGGTVYYRDADGDTYGTVNQTTTACAAPVGYVALAGDCKDTDNTYRPGAALACDGTDRDCDGDVDNDLDNDGFTSSACGGTDCVDTDADFRPEGLTCATGLTCADLLERGLSAGDGRYVIDPDGWSKGVGPFTAYCDMTTDGGGWTLFYAATGANGEQPMTSDTVVAGNPLAYTATNLSRAQKKALSVMSRETLFQSSNGTWIRMNAPAFGGGDLTVANSHAHASVILTASNTATALAFAGWSNFSITGGGDFNLSRTDGVTSCGSTTTVSGVDHHSAAYYHLNCNCDRHYLYSYSAAGLDNDAGYDVNTGLGAWGATAGCDSAEGGALRFRVGMR